MIKGISKILVLFSCVLVIGISFTSCGLKSKYGPAKISFNMQGAKALGPAVSNSTRSAARDGDSEYQKAELRKITDEGSQKLLTFSEGCDTSGFDIVNVISDPYGASSDTYLVSKNPFSIDVDTDDENSLFLGQIIAIHEDGTYTNVSHYQNRNDYGWLIRIYSYLDSFYFDKEGNLYYVYFDVPQDKPSNYSAALYKYSPSTRQVTKLTSFKSGDFFIEYEISSDSKWAFVTLRAIEEKDWGEYGENNWLYAISLENPENPIEIYKDDMEIPFAYDNRKKALYYEASGNGRFNFEPVNFDNPDFDNSKSIYKIELNENNTFDPAASVEIARTIRGLFYMTYTESGLWYFSPSIYPDCTITEDNYFNILDEADNIVDTGYYVPTYVDGLALTKIDNLIFIQDKNQYIIFDTISKTAQNLFDLIPDYENLEIVSASVNIYELYFSAVKKDTNEVVNGKISLQTKEVEFFSSSDKFLSIAIVNEEIPE